MNNISLFSLNDFLILEPYQQGQGLQAEVKNGFAFVKQKNELVGLKLLAEARLSDGGYLPIGSTVYIPEELLTTAVWAKQSKRCQALGDKQFIIVEKKYAALIDTNEVV
jgi:hypothetical protein